MKTISSSEIRNHLGSVLDQLSESGEPILVSIDGQVRAVLITPEDFEDRFADKQLGNERRRLLERIQSLKEHRIGNRDSIEILRDLRGYKS